MIISRHFPDRYETDDNDDERCHHMKIQPRRVDTADIKKFIFSHICLALITIKNFFLTYLLHVEEQRRANGRMIIFFLENIQE